ncbi:osmoprotectant ABC transporter substrate-binding protein [Atopobacter phocae]|uniref:osmoprotectant ABC transporter substrate-binding protein n=1 Tax=Atopobacter phocae TaxID=136492 RepID=UPI0006854CA4|nr:osmoprotectant ABC transporter substrate-binding protein [Atopobacter phocae]
MLTSFIALFLVGCGLPGLSSGNTDTIKVTALSTSEGQTTAGIIKELIEHETDYKVDIINNLGTSTVTHEAIKRGDADIAGTRYTGTDVSGILGLPAEKDPQKALELVQKEFKERYNMKYYDSFGFANSYSFMVTKETADKYGLKTISDLKDIAGDLTAGVDSSWMSRDGDGYDDFVKEYGFDFNKVYPMQIGLVYNALAAGQMDIVLGYSTDGRIQSYDLVVLEDDLHFFPPYDASPLITEETLKKYPELDELLERLVGKISTEDMQKLNFEVDDRLKEPAVVAKEFLEVHDYFKGGQVNE